MSKKILIDLIKCRECDTCQTSCTYDFHPENNGMRDLLEAAVFQHTCRKCESSPCIEVCPADALEKNDQGVLSRATNLCVSCHSCVAICPFGTMLNDFFEKRKSICNLCDLDDKTESLLCVETCPENALELVEIEADESENIYSLNSRVLIKEHKWEKLIEN
jgi:formate dehydrogenase iron-sulfur subunit